MQRRAVRESDLWLVRIMAGLGIRYQLADGCEFQ